MSYRDRMFSHVKVVAMMHRCMLLVFSRVDELLYGISAPV